MTDHLGGDQTKKPKSSLRVCSNCRERHLKCDYGRPCNRCQRSGDECFRPISKIKFRHGSSAKYETKFRQNQTWLKTAGRAEPLQYIDETDELEAYYTRDRETSDESDDFESTKDLHNPTASSTKQQSNEVLDFDNGSLSPTASSTIPQSNEILDFDTGSLNHRASSSISRSNEILDFDFGSPNPTATSISPNKRRKIDELPYILLEAVLMRYFVEVLAPWFDLCDPERHFTLIVPQRARICPPLLNAIFAASARHLTRLKKYKRLGGVQWNNYFLPDLTTETMLYYHNECISNLIQLSMDPDQMQNDNLLAAASILRWHEEVDAPFCNNEEGDMFLKVINIFVNAQVPSTPAIPHSLPFLNQDSPDTTTSDDHPKPRVIRADGLRQAAFWVAVRQSIYDSFMKQRPISFPLDRCIAFRTYELAEDAVWADRLIIFCADVLQFCYGQEKSSKEQWDELLSQERKWSEVLPPSFQPIYSSPPTKQEVFPEIWYLSDCHVTGIQHMELARILLTVYNPNLPRLGPGSLAAMKEMSNKLRNIVLRLCGIAIGNRRTPPGFVTACMGIAMCGEHFTEYHEQEALVGVLDELDREHAWPTKSTKQALKSSWGWD